MAKLGRIGLFFTGGLTMKEMISMTKIAEEENFDSVWSSDIGWRDPFTPLAAFALNTRKIKLGTGISGVSARTPLATALAAVSLDEISNGRFTLGLGTQPPSFVEEWYGTPYRMPRTRVKEHVEIVKSILKGSPVYYEGSIYSIKNFKLFQEPVRRNLPIYTAGIGPKMISLAGEVADGLIGNLYSVRYIKDVVLKQLEAGAKRAGRRFDELDVAGLFIACVSKDSQKAKDMARGQVAMYASLGYYTPILVHEGFEEEMRQVRKFMEAGNPDKAVASVSDEMIERFTISGNQKEFREALKKRFEAGVKLAILYPVAGFHSPYPTKEVYTAPVSFSQVYKAALEAAKSL